jgi:hypothetical protein
MKLSFRSIPTRENRFEFWLCFATVLGIAVGLLFANSPSMLAQESITNTPSSAEQSAEALEEEFDVERTVVPLLNPGTIVNDKAPDEWTHLILKSNPAVTQGDISDVSQNDKNLSSLVRTASVANVVKRQLGEQTVFQLSHVAIGLCVNIDGNDTVVSPDTQKKLGAGLGFIARTVLGKIYEEQSRVELVARSDYAAIYDAPIILRWEGKNREEVLRYAILVDPKTGDLKTFVWMIEYNDGKYMGFKGKVQLLSENCVMKCDLHVDSSEYTFGIPSKVAYACASIPVGKVEFPMPASLEEPAGLQELTSDAAASLVKGLRKMLRDANK